LPAAQTTLLTTSSRFGFDLIRDLAGGDFDDQLTELDRVARTL
jgi:hypothetical protein